MILLGLGSNKGDRREYLRRAVRELRGVLQDMRLSRVVESRAVLPPGAPPSWDMPYLNMAVAGRAEMAPLALLACVKAIEDGLGRVKTGVWGPREIDIDILAMGQTLFVSPQLVIPHREMTRRDFVMLPLCDVAAEWRYPGDGTHRGYTVTAMAQGFGFGEHLQDRGALDA
jgi:2-amino-4-hydroxy-6-hydroxymethyldihydropteridine diphosphokinase